MSEPSEHERSAQLQDRVVTLESLVMHLQYDIEQLNNAVLSQHREIGKLSDLITRMERRITQLQEPSEVRDAEAERPPHY